MDEQHRKRLLELIRNPPPGSKLEAARDYGIDLSLFLRSLEMTPAERLRELGAAQPFLRALWGAAKRNIEEE